jgi:hypothetical protein
LLGRRTALLPIIGSGDAKQRNGEGCIAFLDKKWLSGGLRRHRDATAHTLVTKAVGKPFSGRDYRFKPRQRGPDTADDHRCVSAVRVAHDGDALCIHPPLEHYMVCIPFDGAIDGKRDVRRAVACLIGIVCHIPKIFGDPHPGSQTPTVAPDVLHTNGDIAMGCQVFCLCEVGVDIAARAVRNDNNCVVFTGLRVVNPKGNKSFFAKCAALNNQL